MQKEVIINAIIHLLGDTESSWNILHYAHQRRPIDFAWLHNRQAYRALPVPDKRLLRRLLSAYILQLEAADAAADGAGDCSSDQASTS